MEARRFRDARIGDVPAAVPKREEFRWQPAVAIPRAKRMKPSARPGLVQTLVHCVCLTEPRALMGATRDDFIKYPRTPHLFGSKGTDDDKHLGQKESEAFIADPSLIVEEKIDGTNVGIHFTSGGRMVLQCRGHEITEGMHPQYDLFKQWTSVKRAVLEAMLEDRFILYGEWVYAKHSVHYRALPHYFFEFDIWDKDARCFLTLERRL